MSLRTVARVDCWLVRRDLDGNYRLAHESTPGITIGHFVTIEAAKRHAYMILAERRSLGYSA